MLTSYVDFMEVVDNMEVSVDVMEVIDNMEVSADVMEESRVC